MMCEINTMPGLERKIFKTIIRQYCMTPRKTGQFNEQGQDVLATAYQLANCQGMGMEQTEEMIEQLIDQGILQVIRVGRRTKCRFEIGFAELKV